MHWNASRCITALVRRIIEMSGLIASTGQIWLAVEPVDMRRGIDGLSMLVQQTLDESGALCVHRSSANRQQPGRKCNPSHSHRQEKLDVHRLQTCRTTCCSHSNPIWHRSSSTISILPHGSKTRSPNSPPGLIAALMSCCR